MMGGLIMCHGDDAGLRVPPVLAATQAVVLAVRDEGDVVARARAITGDLVAAGVRAVTDDKTSVSLGRRVTDWELKGAPVRVEVGPRDLAEGVATVVCRITGEKAPVALEQLPTVVVAELDRQQGALFVEAQQRREAATVDVATLDDAREAATTGWARVPWSVVGDAGEAELATAGVTVRCLTRPDASVPDSPDEPDLVAVVSRAY
jgi:prolyl-tRNA synthetase